MAKEGSEALSPFGRSYLAGLLEHARASTVFTTPTINGYKRYRSYSLAPDRAIWGRDNRGVMIRVLGGTNDPATRLENRIGEPAANPYLYMAANVAAGLDGMRRGLQPPPAVEAFSGAGCLITAQQLLIGGALGFCLQILFDAVTLGGQVLANGMGLSLAYNIDPLHGGDKLMVVDAAVVRAGDRAQFNAPVLDLERLDQFSSMLGQPVLEIDSGKWRW